MILRRFALLGSLALLTMPVHADYFFDQSMLNGRVRTDYNAIDEGTSTNPLTLIHPCLWPAQSCETGPAVFSTSNHYARGGSGPTHWVLMLNNEPWENESNPGPPNQSIHPSIPGLGLMGFARSLYISGGQPPNVHGRFHLALSHLFPNPVNQAAAAFLSIGAAANRGNGGEIGALNDPSRPHTVEFRAFVEVAFGSADPVWVASFFMWTTAEWEGVPRMLFIHLYHEGITPDGPWGWSTDEIPGLHLDWNWPIQESSLHPGADVAYMDAEDVATHCGGYDVPRIDSPGFRGVLYNLDLQRLYRCASDHGLFNSPMPESGVLPITGVHWANELVGDGTTIYSSVAGARMLPPVSGGAETLVGSAVDEFPAGSGGHASQPSDEDMVALIRERLRTLCAEHDACDETSTSIESTAARRLVPDGDYATRQGRRIRLARELYETRSQ